MLSRSVPSARQRRAAAYIAPMSHLDLTFMGSIEECLSRGAKVFTAALDLLDTQPEFRFFLEYTLFLEAYRQIQPTQCERLDAAIRAGRVEIGPAWSGIFVNLEDEEDLIRNILYAKRDLHQRYGLEPDTLQLTDLPGAVPQLAQVCIGLGIKHLVLTRCAPPDTLFWYEAPNGDRVLVWSADGYHEAGRLGAHQNPAALQEKLAIWLEAETAPPLLYYGSDLYLPPPGLVPTITELNAQMGSDCRIEITTPGAYFRQLADEGWSSTAPILTGSLPSTWLHLEPSHAHITRWDGLATRSLDAAERLSTLAFLHTRSLYPKAELEELRKVLLRARDHNFGGKGAGIGQPRKLAERRFVRHRAQLLQLAAMASIAERVEVPGESIPLVVFNVLNWSRSDVVQAHVSFYPGIDPVLRDIVARGGELVLRDPHGRPVPYQIIDDRRDTLGEIDLAFVAEDVPGLGYASYTLEPAEQGSTPAVSTSPVLRRLDHPWYCAPTPDLILSNGEVTVSIDRATGAVRFNHASDPTPLVTGLRLVGRSELPEVERKPPLGLSLDDPAREQVTEAVLAQGEAVTLVTEGPISSLAAVRTRVLGDVPCELRVKLSQGLPWIDVEVRIDWDVLRFGRIELTYDVPLAPAQVHYGLPFGAGVFAPDELLAGSGPIRGDEARRSSWERMREISRWLDISDGTRAVAMTTDHRWTWIDPATEDGGPTRVRCCLVRGGRMRALDPVADGDDPRVRLVFQVRFSAHQGTWQKAHVPRLGWETVQPMVSYTVNDTWSPKLLPRQFALATFGAESGEGDALLTCLKQAEDDETVIARWYEATGHPCLTTARLPTGSTWQQVNLLETPIDRTRVASSKVETDAWEIVTVRADNG